MRSTEEIKAKMNEIKDWDFLGFAFSDLAGCLSFDDLLPFLKPDHGLVADEWEPNPRDRESLIKTMKEYMPFAWDKANNKRGISSYRSLAHFTVWTWLAGDDLGDLFDDGEAYGKESLIRICEHYGWDYTQWDDGVRTSE